MEPLRYKVDEKEVEIPVGHAITQRFWIVYLELDKQRIYSSRLAFES